MKKWLRLFDQTTDGDGGQAAPPAATPEPAPAPEPSAEPAPDSGPISDFTDLLDDADEFEGEEPAAIPAGEAPAAPAASPSAPAAPVPSPAPPQAAVPAQPAAPATPPAAPVTPAITPEQIAEFRKKALEELEAHYKLPDDEAVALATEPEKVLPRLAARLQMQVMDEVARQLQRDLPLMLQTQQLGRETETKARGQFFGEWPGLAEHEAQVLEVGKMFRAANPQATPEMAIETVGRMTAMALGLDEAVVRRKAESAPSPATAASPVPQPRRPVGVGSAGGAPPPTSSSNIFEQFADDVKRGVDDDF